MSGHRGHLNSRPAREIFLTSSSLSFSSLSSSVSWDDAIELKSKDPKASSEDKCHQQNGELSNASSSQGSEISGVTHVRMQPASSSQGSEMSGLTHVRMQPVPSPPSRSRPVPLMNRGIVNYDPERIPPSVFGKTGDVTWSEVSNESLFSLKFDGYRKSNAQASRQSNLIAEEVLMSGEFLRYSPSLLATPEDAKEKRSEMEINNGETRVESRHQKYSLSTPDVPLSTIPSNFYCLYQAPPKKVKSFSIPVGEKKSKKIKKTRKSKKKEKKKKKKKKKEEEKKNQCCMWSWLCSVFSKCECDLSCYKWRKCCCCCCIGPKTMVL